MRLAAAASTAQAHVDRLPAGYAPGPTQSVGSVEIRRDVEGLASQLSVLYALDLERAELTARAVVTDHSGYGRPDWVR